MKRLFGVLVASIVAINLLAVPASPYPIAITQPDGSVLTVQLHGDEYASYYSTLEGTPLRQLSNGFFVEDASVFHEFTLKAKSRRQQMQTLANQIGLKRNVAPKTNATTYPLQGSPKSLVILVGFKDLPFKQTLQDFDNLLNQSGYSYNSAYGSCRDYFIAASDSIFQPQFDVYGPYTLDNNVAYYGGPVGEEHDAHPEQMVIEACQMAAAAGVDFDEYDTDNDGVLDNVFVFYAGNNQAEGGDANTIWPHKWSVSWTNTFVDGKLLATYACTSEYRGTGTTRAGIGTFCHEFGHVLGLPDFYDTEYKYYSIANWDIMCTGSYNNAGRTPPTYSAYERFFLGWLKPVQLQERGQYSLSPIEESNQAYLLANGQHNMIGDNPNPSEFFMLEYRKKTGWDAYLPGEGMLVWHIDYLASAWTNNTPNNGPNIMRVHLEEANGITWKDRTNGASGSASDPYPGTMNVTAFTPKLHNGTVLSEQNIFDITNYGNWIGFIYQGVGEVQMSTSLQELSMTTTVSDNKKIEEWNPQSFELIFSDLVVDTITLSTQKSNFFVAVGETAPARSSKEWKRTLEVKTDTLPGSIKVWVSYVPSGQSCDEVRSSLSISTLGANLSVSLVGYSPRPIYITTPIMKMPTNVSPYSFRMMWEPVEDAVLYYVTLYKSLEGESAFMQGFENFSDFVAIRDEGWDSNTNLTTTSAKSEGTKSLYFKNTGDQITTEKYLAPVKNISFWINAFTSDVTEVGTIDLEAWNGDEWVKMPEKTTKVLATTKRKTVQIDFDETTSFTQFRLTYTDNGGNGVAVDAFIATCSQNVEYIYRGKDLSIDAFSSDIVCSYEVTQLAPNTTYYYSVQSSDITKGCEEHISEMSTPLEVTTMAVQGENGDVNQLPIVIEINYDRITHVVYLSNPQTGSMLQIFDVTGKMVYSCPTITGVSEYVIPTELLQKHCLYMVKYVENGKLKRKQLWTKFIY